VTRNGRKRTIEFTSELAAGSADASRERTGMKAVILAGGKGTRLAPYTSVLPKPLMPIGDRAILEIVVEQLDKAGFDDITLSVGYLSHLIQAVFEHGPCRHLDLTHVREEQARGTAGPLRLIEGLDDTFLVMNGDVLTALDLRELVDHHRQSGNILTIAAQRRTTKMDYGVLHLQDGAGDGLQVAGYEEKPDVTYPVSMGVYVFEPGALAYIPDGYFDFPDLVGALLASGEPVGAYFYDGFWLDVGRHEDYENAVERWELNGGSLWASLHA
jgi:NDP-sugar pyrophosphorylase family protein